MKKSLSGLVTEASLAGQEGPHLQPPTDTGQLGLGEYLVCLGYHTKFTGAVQIVAGGMHTVCLEKKPERSWLQKRVLPDRKVLTCSFQLTCSGYLTED